MKNKITKENLESRGLSAAQIKQYFDSLNSLRKELHGIQSEESFETFYENFDGYRFFYQEWDLPKKQDLKGIIFCLHGFLSHSDYFYPIADYFTPLGLKVIALDYRGHGRTGGMMGGKLGSIENFNLILEDIHALIWKYQSLHPDIPIFLLGLDLGSIFAIKIKSKYVDLKIKKVILIAPPIKILLSAKNKLTKGGFQILSKIMKVDSMMPVPEWTKHPSHTYLASFNEFLKADKLSLSEISVKSLGDFLNYCSFLNKYIDKADFPVQIFQGTGDTYTDPFSAHELFQRWPHKDRNIRLYENANHMLLFDKFAQEIWERMKEFIMKDVMQ